MHSCTVCCALVQSVFWTQHTKIGELNHYFISMKCMAGLSVEATGALFMDQYQANYQHFKGMHLDTCRCLCWEIAGTIRCSWWSDVTSSVQSPTTCHLSWHWVRFQNIISVNRTCTASRTSPPVFVQKPKPQVVAHIRERLGCMSFWSQHEKTMERNQIRVGDGGGMFVFDDVSWQQWSWVYAQFVKHFGTFWLFHLVVWQS